MSEDYIQEMMKTIEDMNHRYENIKKEKDELTVHYVELMDERDRLQEELDGYIDDLVGEHNVEVMGHVSECPTVTIEAVFYEPKLKIMTKVTYLNSLLYKIKPLKNLLFKRHVTKYSGMRPGQANEEIDTGIDIPAGSIFQGAYLL